jgi:predicted SAM-dependent methyltransferase
MPNESQICEPINGYPSEALEACKKFLKRVGLFVVFKKAYEVFIQCLGRLTRRGKIKRYFESDSIKKLQIGSGRNILKGWLNTDFMPSREIIFLDATKRLPFDDCSFDYILCEHLIEHLEYPKGMELLYECFRVLRLGGKIRIATPDLSFLIELYNQEKNELQNRYISWAVNSYLSEIGIHQDTFVINNFFRNWGHKFIYDYKSLQMVMSRIGFINIARHNAGESDDESLRNLESHGRIISDEFNKLETLVCEGTKPER